MPTMNEKGEEIKTKLQGLRKALRVMHAGVVEETILPEVEDVRAAIADLESLLKLMEDKENKND